MCELLGISVSPPAQMGLLLKAFRPRAAHNPSGWGMGWYEGSELKLVKEPVRADESETAEMLADDPPISSTFMIHVRAATIGDISEANTHPFAAKAAGRHWLFAHNGTINDLGRLDCGSFVQDGQTDSEYAFHHLLTRIAALGDGATDTDIARDLLNGARELSADGRANFLLTDGETLYAYHDGHKTLHFLERRSADAMTVAEDADYTIELSNESSSPDQCAVIVASVPLTDENWTRCEPGEFLVCRDGRLQARVKPGGSLDSLVGADMGGSE